MRKFNVVVNGTAYAVEVEEVGEGASVAPAPAAAAPAAAPAPKAVVGDGTPVPAPLPGLILSLSVSDGAVVKKNDKIAVLEAMKMENDVFAPADGKITYAVKKGDNVETGAVLAYIK